MTEKSKTVVCENGTLGEKYYKIQHRSGLNIYVFPKKLSTAYALFATKFGAADNSFRMAGDPEFTDVPDGIAHFLEHKMFENEDGSDTFELFARTGANANAYTSSHTTAYLFSCTENFEESLGILLDMVTHPYFSEKTVQKEQGIIAQEIRMGEDSPSRALYYGMLRSMYHVNPVRINVAGTVESISEITAELLYKCHRIFYNLRNMALFICGDVTAETVAAVADAHLETAPPLQLERRKYTEPPEPAERRFAQKMQIAKPLFAIGLKDIRISADPRERMRRQCVMDILNEMLFSQSSVLRNSLYEEGLIGPSLSYGYGICADYAYNSISGESAEPEKVYEKCFAYIRKMAEDGVDPEAFERCKRVIYADCVSSYDDTSEIAHALLDTVFDDEDLFAEPELIASVARADVEDALRTIFDESKAVLAVIEPLDAEEQEERA